MKTVTIEYQGESIEVLTSSCDLSPNYQDVRTESNAPREMQLMSFEFMALLLEPSQAEWAKQIQFADQVLVNGHRFYKAKPSPHGHLALSTSPPFQGRSLTTEDYSQMQQTMKDIRQYGLGRIEDNQLARDTEKLNKLL
jgi:hypothetical protein